MTGPSPRQAAETLAAQLLALRLPDYLLGAAGPNGPAPAIVHALAETALALDDAALRQGVLDALARLSGPHALDEAWAVWEAHRNRPSSPSPLDSLFAALQAAGRPAGYPPALHVLSALALDQVESLVALQAEGVEPLLRAARDPDPQLAARAQDVLRRLDEPAAREELCRQVIEHDDPLARQAALQAGYAPQDVQRRALFFLLTEQWERYSGLDFDASLLRAVWAAGEEPLRARIADAARRAGWGGFVEAVAGERAARALVDLAPVEWEVVLTLLSRQARWEEAWRLAQAAPPLWSARLLRDLAEAAWLPPDPEEAAALAELSPLARRSLQSGPPAETWVRPLALLRGHSRLVTALAFSPDGALLASASGDRSLRLWAPSGASLGVLEAHTSYVLALAFLPSPAESSLPWLASGSADRTARVWRLVETPGGIAGETVHVLGGHSREVASLAVDPGGALLACGDGVGVRLWRLADGKLLHQLGGATETVVSLKFGLGAGAGAQFLAGGDEANTLHWWPLPEGQPARRLMENASAWVLLPAGHTLATASPYGRVRLWELPSGELQATLDGRTDGSQVAVDPGGRTLAASDRGLIHLWELGNGQSTAARPRRSLERPPRPLAALAFSPEGRLLVSAGEDKTLQFWQVDSGRLLRTAADLHAPARAVAFSPDGRLFAAGDEEVVRLWALEDLGAVWRASPTRLGPAAFIQAEAALEGESGTEAERAWLEFARRLVTWRQRHDIEIGPPKPVQVGEMDIEIET